MSKSALNRVPNDVGADIDLSEDELVARIAADRKAGKDTAKDVEALLRLAGEKNRAALDRLAQ